MAVTPLKTLLEYCERGFIGTTAVLWLRKIVEGLQGNIDAGGGGGGGAVPRTIFGHLQSANAITLITGTEVTAILAYDITLDVTDSWVIASDNVCSAVIDVQRATVAAPGTFVSIAGSSKPTLTADTYNTGLMTGWTVALLAGEQIRFIVESASGTDEVRVSAPGVG